MTLGVFNVHGFFQLQNALTLHIQKRFFCNARVCDVSDGSDGVDFDVVLLDQWSQSQKEGLQTNRSHIFEQAFELFVVDDDDPVFLCSTLMYQ